MYFQRIITIQSVAEKQIEISTLPACLDNNKKENKRNIKVNTIKYTL